MLTGYRGDLVDKALQTGSLISRPFRSPFLYPDEKGELRAERPTIVAAAAVPDDHGHMQAVLSLRIRPEAEFTEILQMARSGQTGETFAFDDKGMILSQSRFDDDLKQIGLLADLPDSHSVLTLELRDPGVNMMDGERPEPEAGRPAVDEARRVRRIRRRRRECRRLSRLPRRSFRRGVELAAGV